MKRCGQGCFRFTLAAFVLASGTLNLMFQQDYDSPVSSPEEWKSMHLIPLPEEDATLVVQLRGEVGNHLSAIAHGMCFKWYASETFGVNLQVKLRHQVVRDVRQDQDTDSRKWQPTRDKIQKCFPKLRFWNFDRGIDWKEYYDSESRLTNWVPPLTRKHLGYINGRPWQAVIGQRDPIPSEFGDWNKTITTLQALWHRKDRPSPRIRTSSFVMGNESLIDAVSIPFIRSESLENTLVADHCLDQLRDLFEYDMDSCCGNDAPGHDETILHLRNFATELAGDPTSGLEDLKPRQTSEILLEHLKAGDRVAVATRIINDELQRHVDILRERGLEVRVIEGQTDMQDFCFLLQTRKELVGNFQSTFVFWAAILGSAKKIRLHTVESPRLRERCGYSDSVIQRRFSYNWTHPALRERLQQSLIPFDGDDQR